MSKSMLAYLCAAVVGSATTSPLVAAPTKMVACELFSLSDLSSVVGANLKRLTTAPESRLSYGAMRSACGYHDGLRHGVTVRLAEFPSLEKATSEYVEKTTQTAKPIGHTEPDVMKPQSGIGDKASWLEHTSHSSTAYTYVVLKGNFVLDLVVFTEHGEGRRLIERLRPLVHETAGRL
jgi:hypothetical protein